MEIITALAIPMEAGKKFKKEELIEIIQTHLNTHPELKDKPRFIGLFGGRRQQGSTQKENLPAPVNAVVNANASASGQHLSRTMAPLATSQPSIPNSHVQNFASPDASHPFTPLSAQASHSFPAGPAHYHSGPISYNLPQYPFFNNSNRF